ncbi:MAG: DUF2135 domain-containing protein [Planctomycetes bacterium]|nr:DUF2135 domain-containing protein [Planctomycetota bacterium]
MTRPFGCGHRRLWEICGSVVAALRLGRALPLFPAAAMLVCALGSRLAAEDPACGVRIASPDGGWSSQRVVHVRGSVFGGSSRRAFLVTNGSYQVVSVVDGNFDVEQVLSPGENVIQVWAETPAGYRSDAVVVHSTVPPLDVKVTLTWDTDASDVDLWVTDPTGEKCFYEHKETAIGGRLDIDVTDGYGPETFTLPCAVPGNYLIEAHFFGDAGQPQARCRATVALREGTPAEERRSYEFLLTHTGDVARITSLAVGVHR